MPTNARLSSLDHVRRRKLFAALDEIRIVLRWDTDCGRPTASPELSRLTTLLCLETAALDAVGPHSANATGFIDILCETLSLDPWDGFVLWRQYAPAKGLRRTTKKLLSLAAVSEALNLTRDRQAIIFRGEPCVLPAVAPVVPAEPAPVLIGGLDAPNVVNLGDYTVWCHFRDIAAIQKARGLDFSQASCFLHMNRTGTRH